MEQNARLNYLLHQLSNRHATDAELTELQQLVERDENNQSIGYIEEQLSLLRPSPLLPFDKEKWMTVADKILAADKLPLPDTASKQTPVISLKRRWVAAVAVLLICSSLAVWLLNTKETNKQPAAKLTSQPVPGKQGAILTLADGSTVLLDSAAEGLIAKQEGTAVQLNNGSLAYDATGAEQVAFNTLTTPKGRKYQVVLPDGTKVWLNAGSSITYPTAFKGKERRVTMRGEVYFEVASNAAMPFYVTVDEEAELKVLGTHFNLNSFQDNGSIDATLLEGAVAFGALNMHDSLQPKKVQLKPGQQARLGQELNVVNNADIGKIMAWKNGFFNFDDDSLVEVMRQLERWYDIQVIYPAKIPDIIFFGELNMNTPLEGVLLALERSGVHFSVNGRTITVTE